MGTPIMANKNDSDNPTISNFFMITNTIYSARITESLGDGDCSAFAWVFKTPFFFAKYN